MARRVRATSPDLNECIWSTAAGGTAALTMSLEAKGYAVDAQVRAVRYCSSHGITRDRHRVELQIVAISGPLTSVSELPLLAVGTRRANTRSTAERLIHHGRRGAEHADLPLPPV